MTRKIAFFEGWSWFKFNKLGLTLGTNLKFCISVAKGLKLKVRNILGVILTFVEITGKKLVEGAFLRQGYRDKSSLLVMIEILRKYSLKIFSAVLRNS